MTFAQTRRAALGILRNSRKLFGYKLRDLDTGYIYCPYIPLIMTPPTPEELAETRRQLLADASRVQEHIEASRNVDLMVQ